jgi:ferrochelatase
MASLKNPIAILLMAMGGPDKLDNVEPYLLDVRGGRPTSPEFIAAIRERYRLTGGKSPVLGITREVARKLEQKLNGPGGERYRVYVGLRHWHPTIKEAYAELLDDRPQALVGICMAPQYSSLSIGAYSQKLDEARAALGGELPMTLVRSWHQHPGLIQAIVENIHAARQKFPPAVRESVPILFTAHSLPERILAMQDPYPGEVKATVEAVCARLAPAVSKFAYQSQGQSGEQWLGPTVEAVLADLAREGHRHVLIAPIGFICDHLEVLYDVDIDFKQRAQALGIQLERIDMLNASAALIDILASVVEAHHVSSVR